MFYKQNAEKDGYVEANRVSTDADRPSFSISDKYSGYKADHYQVNNGRVVRLGEKDSDGYYARNIGYRNSTLKIYFNRLDYKISYMDGIYIDGNMNPIQNNKEHQLHVSGDITYGSDISSYGVGGANYWAPEDTDEYIFMGWYADADGTQPYVFTAMPEDGITVYAKWIRRQYRVFLHPQAETDPNLEWGSEDQAMNFRISYGESPSLPEGRRTGYDFVGWYTSPSYSSSSMFMEGTPLNETTVKTAYDKTSDFTDPMDKWGNGATRNSDITGYNGGDRFWITKKLDLYAKWSSKLEGADGIQIVYDLNGGTGTASDPNHYKDSAEANAVPAVTAPAGKQFSYWVIQKWNGSAYEDTDKAVFPGQQYTVLKEYARVQEAEGSTPEKPKNTYTMQLRAQFDDIEKPKFTTITYKANGGTGADVVISTIDGNPLESDGSNGLKVNDKVTSLTVEEAGFTRDGYTFVEWNTQADGSGTAFAESVDIAADLLNRDGGKNPAANILYAIWKPQLKITITGGQDTKTYNGSEQSVEGFTVSYKYGDTETPTAPEGVSVTLKSGAAAQAAGTNAQAEKYMMGLTADSFTIVTGSYGFDPAEDLTVNDGWLKIDPAQITVSILGTKVEVPYDGNSHTASGYTASSESSLFDQSKIVFTGTASVTGTAADTYPMGLTDTQFSYNDTNVSATFRVTDGELKITPATITLTVESYEGTYDGKPHTVTVTPSVTDGTTISYSTDNENWSTTAPTWTDATEARTVYVKATNPAHGLATGSGTVTITKAAITINGTKTETYDGTEWTLNIVPGVNPSGLVSNETMTLVGAKITGTDVGEYTEVSAYEWHVTKANGDDSDGNYTISVTGKLTIEPAEMSVTVDAYRGVYDGKPHTVTATPSVAEGTTVYYSTDNENWSATAPTFTDVAAEAQTVYVKAENKNYQTATGQNTVTIIKKAITVNDTKTETYDGNEKTLSIAADKATGVLSGETLTLTGAAIKGTNQGTYTNVSNYTWSVAKADGTTDSTGNYDIEVTGTLTINKGRMLLTATGFEGQFNAQPHAVSATPSVATGTKVEYRVGDGNWSETAPSKTDICDLTVSVRATNPNYETATASAVLKITPAPATVTAQAASKVYEAPDPTFEATVSGIFDNEDFTLEYTVTRPRAGTDEEVGTYEDAIVPAGAAAQGNYTVTYVPADFQITASGTLTVTANGYTGTYDGKEHAGSATANITSGTTIEYKWGNGNWSTTAPSITDVGELPFEVRATNKNYATATARETLTVNPREVTVTADNKEKFYKDPDPAFTATVSGTLGSDTVAYTLGRDAGEDVGEYAITPTGEETQGNYVVSYEPGVLTIKNGTLTLNADGYEGVYDAASHAASASASIPEALIEYHIVGEGEEEKPVWTTEAPSITDVGEIRVEVRASLKNYDNVTATVTLKVTPRPVTVTAEDKTKDYGAADPVFTAVMSGLLGQDRIGYQLTRDPGEDVGDYAIRPQGDEAQGNYTVTFVPGKLTINPMEITVTADDKTKVYGDADPELTAKVTGLANADAQTAGGQAAEFTPAYKLSRAAGENVGEYIITPAGAEIQGNYKVAYVAAKLTITPAAAVVTAEDKTKVYGTADPALTAKVDGLKNGDAPEVITYQLTRAAGEDAGEYAITAAGKAAQGNYTVTYAPGKLTITPVATEVKVTITGNKLTAAYNGKEQSAKGYTVKSDNDLYTEKLFTFSGTDEVKATNVKAGTDKVYAMGLAAAQFANTSRNFTNVTFTVIDGGLEITPAPVTVKANDATKLQGTADPEFTAAVTGLFGEDTVDYSLTREPGETAGTYTITAAGQAQQGNYQVAYENGRLIITAKAAILIRANDAEKVYDGKTVSEAELEEQITVTMPEGYNAADYTFEYTYADGKEIKNVGEYTIITGVIIKDAQGNVVGEYSKANAGNGGVVARLQSAAGAAAEALGIVPMNAYADETAGFDVIVTPGTYTVTRRPVTVTADSVSRRSSEADPAFTAKLENVVAGEENLIKYTVARKTASNTVGVHEGEIVASGAAEQGNYTVSFVPGNLTISQGSNNERSERDDNDPDSGRVIIIDGGEPTDGASGAPDDLPVDPTGTPGTIVPEQGVLGVVREAVSNFISGEDGNAGVLGAARNAIGNEQGVLGAARTGDESGLLLHSILMMLSSASLGGLYLGRRKKREDEQD